MMQEEKRGGMIVQIRMLVFTWIVRLAVWVLPKQAKKTLLWIQDMPLDLF